MTLKVCDVCGEEMIGNHGHYTLFYKESFFDKGIKKDICWDCMYKIKMAILNEKKDK